MGEFDLWPAREQPPDPDPRDVPGLIAAGRDSLVKAQSVVAHVRHIEHARRHDIAAWQQEVAEWSREGIDDASAASAVEGILSSATNPGVALVVALDGADRLLGCARIDTYDSTIDLHNMGVRDRRKGIGTTLVYATAWLASRTGLAVSLQDVTDHAFYPRRGLLLGEGDGTSRRWSASDAAHAASVFAEVFGPL